MNTTIPAPPPDLEMLDDDALDDDALDDDAPIPYAVIGWQPGTRSLIHWANIAPHPAAHWMAEHCHCGIALGDHVTPCPDVCANVKTFPPSPTDQGVDGGKEPSSLRQTPVGEILPHLRPGRS